MVPKVIGRSFSFTTKLGYSEKSMRLFTALDLPDDMLAKLDALLARLRPTAPIRWTQAANLHITVKFIGEWPEERLDELKAGLAGVPRRDAISVHVRDLGAFLNPNKPRIFWCGVDAPGLAELVADTEAATAALGIAREERDFKPHLTLARIKDGFDMTALRTAVVAESTFDFGRFEARSFFLYQSQSKPGGSVYTKLAEFPLLRS
jgi:RNA 2',3'-cyclic 3'-phosphodiesterase